MDLIELQQNIEILESQMILTLDNPKSIKLQIKQISLIQKQLRAIKKELTLAVRQINQSAYQSGPDDIFTVGLDIFGKRKWAGQLRQVNRKAIQVQKINLRQPYLDTKDYVDQLILEGDQLKIAAEQYLVELTDLSALLGEY